MICKYGCKNKAIKQLKDGSWICSNHHSSCPVNRKKNSDSLKKLHKKGMFKYDHLIKYRNWNKGKIFNKLSKIFCKNSKHNNYYIKKILLQKNIKENKCEMCGIKLWNNKPIVLELDHINGISNDNNIKNLRLLCPNCHSQTNNFRGRNKQTGLKKVSDKKIIEELKTKKSIRRILIDNGLSGKGSNYKKIYKIIKDNEKTMPSWRNGLRNGLKIRRSYDRMGSTPIDGTINNNADVA